MTSPTGDLTKALDLVEHARGTGALRTQQPVYVDLLPPCNHACPAGENIQAWLDLAQAGRYEEAWQILIRDNPMPAIHGRVCYHPCEDACNREFVDNSVSIHAVERFLGDIALMEGWKAKYDPEPGGKRVLVVGGGPSGLSAAYHLTRLGHEVEIHEAGHILGGMMHFGIPAYRLPRNELESEIKRIEDMGVKVVLNHRVEDVLTEKETGNFDAVFIAVGAHIGKKVEIPKHGETGKVLDAVDFLHDVEMDEVPPLGKRVAVYGGGNTAMDAARTAKRMGVEEVYIVYRRTREQMPAHDFEADEAMAEGVVIKWLRTIKEIDRSTVMLEVMALDDEGKPQPTAEFEDLEIDSVIMAIGQDTDTSFLQTIPDIESKFDGTVVVSPEMMTGHAGIFAGGDMVPSQRTVTVAVGHGKRAAWFIDGYLRGRPYKKPPKTPVVGYERLHVWYKTDAPKSEQEELPVEERKSTFDEILKGLSEKEALFEAKRCLSCGNCFECDGCLGACSEGAVIKLGPGKRYRFNFELCTGCAVCYEQCPCHAIEMIPEPAIQKEEV
ncbi:MAG: NAD(P)-binding protein [Proteobacteria bacterium]|nr:NAD(P)-binding protein [Pseudomonadota bacterium]